MLLNIQDKIPHLFILLLFIASTQYVRPVYQFGELIDSYEFNLAALDRAHNREATWTSDRPCSELSGLEGLLQYMQTMSRTRWYILVLNWHQASISSELEMTWTIWWLSIKNTYILQLVQLHSLIWMKKITITYFCQNAKNNHNIITKTLNW